MKRSREEKYPDTKYFHYYNANPKNRITGDCRIRAICTALEIPYNDVVMELAQIQCETGYDQTTTQGLALLLKRHGWTKLKQPRNKDNTKMSAKQFVDKLFHPIYEEELGLPEFYIDRIVCNLGSHHMACIITGQVYDIWNSSNETIGNIWVRRD